MQRTLGPAILITALAAALALLLPSASSAASVACGDTITTDTTLTSDLVGCTDGLTVLGATLDLGGHTLGGAGQGFGIRAGRGATLRDGTVTGFGRGIDLEGGDVTVKRLAITDNVQGVGGESTFAILDNIITGNVIGMAMGGGRGTVTGNLFAFNSQDGIENAIAEPVSITDNIVFKNGGRGILVRDATTRVVGNTVSRNGSDGIYVFDDFGLFFPYLIADNTANHNGGYGIAFFGVPTRVDPPSNVDGGGNAAKHNAGPEQCHIIVCTYNRGKGR